MTAAQTIGAGTMIDVAHAFAIYTRDSSIARRIGAAFAPIDVSYTRSLLGDVDAIQQHPAAAVRARAGRPFVVPVRQRHRRRRRPDRPGRGTPPASVRLLGGAAIDARYQHISTANWIARPDSTRLQAEANGTQTRFPDLTVRWAHHPVPGGLFAALDASAGYLRSDGDCLSARS